MHRVGSIALQEKQDRLIIVASAVQGYFCVCIVGLQCWFIENYLVTFLMWFLGLVLEWLNVF